MSVLIKGMEMPKSCADCMVSAQRCGLWVGFKKKTKQRHPCCPLVEVPVPHGRLIDVDALGHFPYNMSFCDGNEADEWVAEAHTVIKAEDTCDGDSCPIHFKDENRTD